MVSNINKAKSYHVIVLKVKTKQKKLYLVAIAFSSMPQLAETDFS